MGNDKKQNSALSAAQLTALSLFASAGGLTMWTGVFGTPVGSAWTVALVGSAAFTALLLTALNAAFVRTGSADAFELMEMLLSRPAARGMMLLLGVWLTARAGQVLGVQSRVTELYLLRDTPFTVTTAAVAATAAVLACGGLRRTARTAELLMLLLAIPAVWMLTATLLRADLRELRVLLQPEWSAFPQQLAPAAQTFAGAECALFFLSADGAKNKEGRSKAGHCVRVAVAVSLSVSAALFAGACGILTLGGVNAYEFPLIEMSRMINIGGIAISERFDVLLIILRTLSVTMQTAVFLSCAAAAFCRAFGFERYGVTAAVTAALSAAAAVAARTDAVGAVVNRICGAGLCAVLFVLIPALWAASVISGKSVRRRSV